MVSEQLTSSVYPNLADGDRNHHSDRATDRAMLHAGALVPDSRLFRLLNRPLRQPVTQDHRRVGLLSSPADAMHHQLLLLQTRAILGKPGIKGRSVDKLIAQR
jgi:hypothetical protein